MHIYKEMSRRKQDKENRHWNRTWGWLHKNMQVKGIKAEMRQTQVQPPHPPKKQPKKKPNGLGDTHWRHLHESYYTQSIWFANTKWNINSPQKHLSENREDKKCRVSEGWNKAFHKPIRIKVAPCKWSWELEKKATFLYFWSFSSPLMLCYAFVELRLGSSYVELRASLTLLCCVV